MNKDSSSFDEVYKTWMDVEVDESTKKDFESFVDNFTSKHNVPKDSLEVVTKCNLTTNLNYKEYKDYIDRAIKPLKDVMVEVKMLECNISPNNAIYVSVDSHHLRKWQDEAYMSYPHSFVKYNTYERMKDHNPILILFRYKEEVKDKVFEVFDEEIWKHKWSGRIITLSSFIYK